MKKTAIGRLRWAIRMFLMLLLAFCWLSAAGVEQAMADQPSLLPTETVDGEPCAAGQAIACIASGSEGQLSQAANSVEFLLTLDAQASGCGPCDLVLVTSSSQAVDELVASLEARDNVLFAEPNYQESLQADNIIDLQGNTPLPGASSAAIRPDYTNKQYAFNGAFGIGVPNWNTYDSAGNPTPPVSCAGKVIAVLDTGVDYNHEDLRDAIWSEGTSYPSLVALGGGAHGINVALPRSDGTAYDTTDPMDDEGHGTHVAGIISGAWNGLGVSGVAGDAAIMAVKINNDACVMSMSEALRGYRYVIAAQKAGVDVVAINNSWNDSTYSKSLDMAIREAGRLGAVTVFAAGNDRCDIDMIGQVTNALINNPYAVIVGNSDESGQMADTSCSGKRSVDVFAPGQEIYSTMPTNSGPADETSAPLTVGGVTYACDYESTNVQDNADGSVFGFGDTDDTALSLADDGYASPHSLRLTTTTTETLAVTMESQPLAAGDECRGLCLRVKAPGARHLQCMLSYNTGGTDSREHHVDLEPSSDDWQVLTFPIDRDAAKDALQLTLWFTAEEWQTPQDAVVLIDDMKLTSATVPYGYQDGTSMSAPAVAGSAAVLAAAFPNDDAAKRAARIVGSVKHVDDLTDFCVADGIFRLDKALGQDTHPVLNGASTQTGTVTIEGFFFGDEPGSIAVDGQAFAINSWSDTTIAAQLPDGFSPGEKLVNVTAASGKEGHQFFRIDTPPSLYRRLPLPGRTLSGDPGDYRIASSEFNESFYGANPRALVGLGGSLYYLLATDDGQTTIYRYGIDAQTWTQVYRGGYAASGGACTWDGKILFLAGQPQENTMYLGLFDPATNTAQYHAYSNQGYERRCTLLNTGKGILLAGGTRHKYGDTREPDIDNVRIVDPASMTLSDVTLPDDVSLIGDLYAGAYDEEGNGYLFCGASATGLYKFSFADGRVTCTVLEEGQIIAEAGGAPDHLLSASADGSISTDQERYMVAGPTKSGIIASGPVMTNDAGVVTADTYTMDWGATQFEATDKQMSVTKMFNAAGTTYRGQFYVIGASESEMGGWVFASQPVETLEQPGDVPASANPDQPAKPAKPTRPTKQTDSAGSKKTPASASKATSTTTSRPSTNGTASTRATSATPSQSLPATGDTATPLLALLLMGSAAVALGARSARRKAA